MVEPGQKVMVEPPVPLLITGAALDAKLNSTTGRTSVQLSYHAQDDSDDEDEEEAPTTPLILCTLIPEKVRVLDP